MTEKKGQEKPPEQHFADLLNTVNVKEGGEVFTLGEHLDSRMRAALAGARYHKKDASITLELKFKPASGSGVNIFPAVKVKIPDSEPNPVPMFADNEGSLYLDDPDQKSLPKTAQFRTIREGDSK
jgi:hypothetical protein